MVRQEWVLSRNCSISPRQLALAYATLCAASLTIATLFTLRGAWFVLCYAVLEMSAVGAAFFVYARHATDRERIALADDGLVIELIEKERIREFRMDPRYTRVEAPESRGELIGLEGSGTRVEVGRFLTERKRRELARELKRALASGR
jgi:uncharacterized membrane protein